MGATCIQRTWLGLTDNFPWTLETGLWFASTSKGLITLTSASLLDEPTKAFVVLPYMKGVTERLQKAYKQHNIQLFCKAGYAIRNAVVHPKDPLDLEEKMWCGI